MGLSIVPIFRIRTALAGSLTFGRLSSYESGQGRGRTGDTGIFSPVLYQLSYLSAQS